MGGRDLSIPLGAVDDVRDRVTASSIMEDSVESMDCLLSECDVRGRGTTVDSLIVVLGVGGAGTEEVMGIVVVVGPAEEGGEMNWNCCELTPTR